MGTLGSDVKTILEDRYWDPQSGKVGINFLSWGNYLKMEAEYMYKYIDDIVPPDDTLFTFIVDDLATLEDTGVGDVYNYVFAHEASCGDRIGPGATSNQYAWVCDETSGHEAGLALSNPRFRWKVPTHKYPRSIGYDLKFYPHAINNNKLYLTVAMKFDSLAVGEEVATIRLKALKNVDGWYNGADWTEFQDYINNDELINPYWDNYYEFELHPVNAEVGTTIYNNTYSSVPRDYPFNNYLFEYYIEFTEAISNDLLLMDGAGDFFRHINPEIIWHGNGRMEIDYIVLEDEYHRQVNTNRHDDSMFSWLQVRMNQILSLPNSSNIVYHYTKDEPFQGQFSMYDKLESHLDTVYGEEYSPRLITATHLEGFRITKPGGNNYEHYLNFLAQAKPRTIAVDAYPLQEWNSADILQWNNCTNTLSVQTRIDSIVTKTYKSLAHAVRHSNNQSVRETDIVYIPQIFGDYVPASSDGVLNWRFFKPPRSMNKCLQLLPLCYSADGILDYTLLTNSDYLYDWDFHRLAPLTHGANYMNIRVLEDDTAFAHLTEANQKIAVYGPYLRELNWIDADCLMTNGGSDGVSVSPFYLSQLRVKHPTELPRGGIPPVPEVPHSHYTGYVQCGFYNDVQQAPSFMLVNRRAVYRESGENSVVQLPVDDNFVDASSQTVIFVPSSGSETHFGSEVGLYDPYDGQLYRREGTDIRVSIGPGDGKLLEMCGILPAIVSSDMTLRHKVCLAGDINISANTEVTFEPNTNIVILPYTHLTLDSNAIINFKGTISVGDSVRFTIADSASVNIANAAYSILGKLFVDGNGQYTVDGSTACYYSPSSVVVFDNGANVSLSGVHDFSLYSILQVSNNSCLEFNNADVNIAPFVRFRSDLSTFRLYSSEISAADNSNGDSLVVDNMSVISIENSTIRRMPLYILGSSLDLQNSYITVGQNKPGILVNNMDALHTIRIINNQGRNGISGVSDQGSRGIEVVKSISSVVIKNTDFSGLGTGILKTTNSALPDSIFDCSFTDCRFGIKQTSSGVTSRIENCTFTNIGDETSIGINLSGSTPTITGCTFNACTKGIFFDGSFYAPRDSGVYNSIFNLCDTAIETRASNPIVDNCEFYMNEIGLLCQNDSNANLSNNRGNRFRNLDSNIKFFGDDYYHSYIQLCAGHNDFWHFGTPDQSIASLDFHFDDYYASSSGTAIDVSKNWFEADSIMINLGDNPDYGDYIFAEVLDPAPNTPGTDPDGNNRYLVALNLEANGLFDQASTLYQAILDDGLESEKSYLSGCVDGLFRSGCLQEMQAEILACYLEQKIIQFTPIDSSFCKLLSDYQIKAFVVSGNFQSAIDIVQARIDDPVSVIDSLRAVLDLEIILQLESMKKTKKPLSLKYTQYRYPNAQVFYTMHDEHMKALYRELNKVEEEEIPIPPQAMISANYPNPFNPSTTIAFSIPKDANTKLCIYNIKGQKVKDIVTGDLLKGFHKAVWDGKDNRNRSVGSGVYLISLESGGKTSVRKVTLMK
ncbi:MAG: FlgD immunoglobulin-like domain containing protein [Gammaproteobacteria bacterium]